jgi:hypothetical protein
VLPTGGLSQSLLEAMIVGEQPLLQIDGPLLK